LKSNEKGTADALTKIREGHWTIRRAANFAGLSYREMLAKMAEAGVDSGPTLKELREGVEGHEEWQG
jgi:hypothetical protein